MLCYNPLVSKILAEVLDTVPMYNDGQDDVPLYNDGHDDDFTVHWGPDDDQAVLTHPCKHIRPLMKWSCYDVKKDIVFNHYVMTRTK